MDEFLGVEIQWINNGVILGQKKIIEKLVKVMSDELKNVKE